MTDLVHLAEKAEVRSFLLSFRRDVMSPLMMKHVGFVEKVQQLVAHRFRYDPILVPHDVEGRDGHLRLVASFVPLGVFGRSRLEGGNQDGEVELDRCLQHLRLSLLDEANQSGQRSPLRKTKNTVERSVQIEGLLNEIQALFKPFVAVGNVVSLEVVVFTTEPPTSLILKIK